MLPADKLLDTALRKIGVDGATAQIQQGLTRKRLIKLATEPTPTRYAALRHVIAKAALESTVIGSRIRISLLPPIAAAAGSAFRIGDGADDRLALARWRQVTAYLLRPDRARRAPLVPGREVCEGPAEELADALNEFLEPFIGSDRGEQKDALRGVIVACAAFGYVLFSQPCEYRFQFESQRGGEDAMVVFPGLQMVVGEGGRVYEDILPQVAVPVVELVPVLKPDSTMTAAEPISPLE